VPDSDEETVDDHARVWATRHDLRLELSTIELRDFSVRNVMGCTRKQALECPNRNPLAVSGCRQ